MIDTFEAHNRVDENGNPSGGSVMGTGLIINWQNGPLGRGENRTEPNGAFVETVIASALQRISFYQTAANGKFHCDENGRAMFYLREALKELNDRTKTREARQVEGTHEK